MCINLVMLEVKNYASDIGNYEYVSIPECYVTVMLTFIIFAESWHYFYLQKMFGDLQCKN
jgi:hypothetical protein